MRKLSLKALGFAIVAALITLSPAVKAANLDDGLVAGAWKTSVINDGDVTRYVAATLLTAAQPSATEITLPTDRLGTAQAIMQTSGTLVDGISGTITQAPYPASFIIGGVTYTDPVSITTQVGDLVTTTTVVTAQLRGDAVRVKPSAPNLAAAERVKVFITWNVAKANSRWPAR